jgi:two-component system, cell cycle sensor histidine kinase and response regulator CckA
MAFGINGRRLTLGRKLFLVVSFFVFIVICVYLLGSFRSMILSSVRAYIQEEGQWSKAQKEAVISLSEYAQSQSQADFQAYLNAIRVPLGDKFARLELEKAEPNMGIVFQSFAKGENNLEDIPSMASLFRWFHNVSYMREAIVAWTEADAEIDNLTELADQLHAETFSDHPDSGRVSDVLEKIEETDSRLSLLEDRFSCSLVAWERWLRAVLNALALGASVLLLFLGIASSRYLLRNLRRSESKYERLLDSASDAILVMDFKSGAILEANGRAGDLLKIPTSRLVGMKELELYPPGEEENGQKVLRAGLSGGGAMAESLKLRRADGRSVDVEVSSRLIELDGKQVILGIFRDTSELKRLNRALLALSRCNQELVRASREEGLLENVCKIIVHTGSYRMAWVAIPVQDEEKNVRVAAHSGDETGYLSSIKLTWADTPAGRGPVGTTLRTGEICIFRNVMEDARFAPWAEQAAQHKFLSVISLPLSSEQGVIGALNIYSGEEDAFDPEEVTLLRELATNLGYGIATLRVRSERERAEAEVRSLEDQLRQAQKMESLGRLAGGVAHDFNNLLTVIRGYAELAMPSDLSGTTAKDLHRKINEIMKASDRAQGLIGQLLAFSRKQLLQPRVLDLNHILLDLGAVLPRLIGEDIHLKIRPGPDLHLIKADPNQIQQVLLNLAVNARDAMPGGGTLTIQTANASLPPAPERRNGTERVLLTVTDTGTGIPPDVRSRIFEPFFTTKERGKGTGLGLAMVYGTVTQSGGHIEVHSEMGKGTTFKVFFPPTNDHTPGPPRDAPPAPVEHASETILLVEDEPSVRELISEYLNRAGFKVLEAINGSDGLEKAKSHPGVIHLVITDIVMPGMGGRQLAERLKQTHPETRILFMSGYTDDAVVRQNITERQNFFIEKPFQLHSLAFKIREVLNSAA